MGMEAHQDTHATHYSVGSTLSQDTATSISIQNALVVQSSYVGSKTHQDTHDTHCGMGNTHSQIQIQA